MAEGDEGRRAAQIRAVREVLLQKVALLPGRGWTSEQLAAEVVDAVNAAGDRVDHAACISALDMAEHALDQAEARGYKRAVDNLRDKARFHAWYETSPIPAADPYWHVADYLEAVGPGQGQTEGKTDVLLSDGTHRYWSTHCRHGRHADCSATCLTGEDLWDQSWRPTIKRKPAQCKTCAARCICDCHKPVSDG